MGLVRPFKSLLSGIYHSDEGDGEILQDLAGFGSEEWKDGKKEKQRVIIIRESIA